jgi:hypothetical protein
MPPGKIRSSDSKLFLRWSRNLPLNNEDITLTGIKKPLRQDIQQLPSGDSPPPGTTQ